MKTSLITTKLCAAASKTTMLVCGLVLCALQGLYANDTTSITSENYTSDFVFVKPNTSHWSLFLDAGGNLFDGDLGREINPFYAPTIGVGFAYNFNTTWGIGAEYMFSMHQVKRGENMLLKGNMHRAHAFVTFDIFNVWRPYDPSKIFALNLIAGGGAGYSLMDTTYIDNGEAFVPLVVVGADFQFNVSKNVALGLKGLYSYSMMGDALDGRIKGTSNDGVVDIMLSVRYKIGAKKKTHTLNRDYDLNYIDQIRNNIARGVEPVVQQALANEERKRDTIVVFDTIVVKEQIAPAKVANNIFYAYFDLNKSELNSDALKAIQQAAAQAEVNEDLYVEIIAYGDNTGSIEYNTNLIKARVENVAAELSKEYGIAAERIVGHSGGMIKGKHSTGAYAPNRRAEIRLINKEEFDAISQEQAKCNNSCKLDEASHSSIKTVTVAPGMTLGKIARMQYGKASYWKYIYEANKNILSNPDKIEEGQVLVIPTI